MRVISYYSFRVVIYHKMNTAEIKIEEYDYRKLLFDDYDSDCYSGDGGDGGDGDGGGDGGDGDGEIKEGILDTRWIEQFEKQIIHDEYRLFLKTDITCLHFEIYYLDHNKSCVQDVLSMKYSLQNINQISQNELFSVIRGYQHLNKKYYNFQSLLLYSVDFQDNDGKDVIRALSQYIQEPNTNTNTSNRHSEKKAFIEYTNLLSIDVIYLRPIITMFHEFIGFSVLLYED